MTPTPSNNPFHQFDRKFFGSAEDFTVIGEGALGGKAQGLAFIRQIIREQYDSAAFPGFQVRVPTLTVVTTDVFDRFMERNNLYETALEDRPDDRIAHAFQQADLPVEIVGDLRAIVEQVHTPLAVRSSSLLEDALQHPFAGVYATKMIPNNQASADTRFRRLVEAMKFVYASAFFRDAKEYMRAIDHDIREEKMALVIQEVVGLRHDDRYYPTLAGVARSFNFYPSGHARPEHGVVDLALGLGKTIVDGGVVWTYSPAYPAAPPPHGTSRDLLRQSQTRFWAVNMGPPPAYDPIRETEYMVQPTLEEAERDGVLRHTASTYDPQSDRLVMGTGVSGPRVITFAPILDMPDIPLNGLIKRLLHIAEEASGAKVEIEFAVNLDPRNGLPADFGFLQVRPMLVSDELVEVSEAELRGERVLAASDSVLGNGVNDGISDIVYVRPEAFDPARTPAIAAELEPFNTKMAAERRPYLLIGFGRWGSSDPWLGTPVTWPQISAAKVIVEATRPDMDVDPSQGAHFFHNLTSFRISYFSVHHAGDYGIDWGWLERLPAVAESPHVRHVRVPTPLLIKVDGRTGLGVIIRHGD